MEDNNHIIVKNTVYNVLKILVLIVFPIIIFPYVSRVLHTENVGKINFGSSFVSYFALLASLGTSAYAVRECSRVKDNRKKLGEVASQILSINLCLTAFAYGLMILCLFLIPKFRDYRSLIFIQSLTILFNTVGTDWLNTAMEDFRYITVRTFIFQLAAIVAIFLFIRRPENYLTYAVICMFSICGGQFINIFYRKRFCSVHLTRHMNWKRHFYPILLFVMTLSQQILNNIDITMLGLLKNNAAVGLFSVASKVILIIFQIFEAVTWVVLPQMSYQYVNRNYHEINRLFRYSLAFTAVLVLPCAAGIIILPEEIIYLIGGAEYLPAAGSLRILAVSMLIRSVTSVYGNLILLPSGREKRFMTACAANAIIDIVLNIVLIPRWGINGAAITATVSSLAALFIVMTGIEDQINIENKKSLFTAPVIGTILVSIMCLFARMTIPSKILCIIIAGSCSALCYLLILILMRHEIAESTIIPILKKIIKKR
jgi:O-antigen/teichoic acid export membrane protein